MISDLHSPSFGFVLSRPHRSFSTSVEHHGGGRWSWRRPCVHDERRPHLTTYVFLTLYSPRSHMLVIDSSPVPPDLLRATLRTLLGATHTNPSLFASTIRAHLPVLSPSSFHLVLSGPDAVRDIDDLLVQARIRFASHLIAPALAILSYLLQTIIQQQIRLSVPAAVYDKLVEAGGDMVQSAQALKESGDRSDPARTSLLAIIEELRRYRQFWLKTNSGSNLVPSPFPLDRAIYQYIDTAKIVFPDDSVVMELEPPEYTTIHSPGACKNPLPVVKLGSIVVPRLFFGLWQLSSPAWGSASEEQIIAGLREMVSNGLVAADMAGESTLDIGCSVIGSIPY